MNYFYIRIADFVSQNICGKKQKEKGKEKLA